MNVTLRINWCGIFQIKDAYSLKIFESNSSRLPTWCNNGDSVKLPFCQIRGKYRMELPGYNTMDPYPHMNERCPSLPPNYDRPSGCWGVVVFSGYSCTTSCVLMHNHIVYVYVCMYVHEIYKCYWEILSLLLQSGCPWKWILNGDKIVELFRFI